jgi:hypothetical protein
MRTKAELVSGAVKMTRCQSIKAKEECFEGPACSLPAQPGPSAGGKARHGKGKRNPTKPSHPRTTVSPPRTVSVMLFGYKESRLLPLNTNFFFAASHGIFLSINHDRHFCL